MIETKQEKVTFFSLQNIIIAYLTIPLYIFVTFWTRQPFSWLLVALLTLSLFLYLKSNKLNAFIILLNKKSISIIVALFLTTLFLAVISGAGGYVIQRGDWTKHNVILNDLLNNKWPVYYGAGAYVSDTTLVYYLAYYLPSALFGKYFGGWGTVQVFTFIYTFVGVLLFCIAILQEKVKFWILPLFFLVSGADVVGNVIFGKLPISITHLESYAKTLQLPSFISQITWAPQHTISAWIYAYLIFSDIKNKKMGQNYIFYIGTSLIWSPFVAASIALVSLPFIFRSKLNLKTLTLSISGTIFGSIILLYFKSQINILNDRFSLFWNPSNSVWDNLSLMSVFLIIDIFVFIPIIIFVQKSLSKTEYILAWWCVFLLFIISFFRLGAANDWQLRTSPLIFTILILIIVKNIGELKHAGKLLKIYTVTIFLLGLVTSISQVIVLKDISNPATNERPDRNMLQSHIKYGVIHQQYMGSASRLFGKLVGNYKK